MEYQENTNKEEKSNDNSLNKHLSIFHELILFVIGFLGLSLFGTIFNEIFKSLGMDSSIQTQNWVNFSTYLVLIISCLAVIGPKGIKIIGKQFKHSKNIFDGITFAIILIIGSIVINTIFTYIGKAMGLDMTVNDNESIIRSVIKEMPVLSFCFVVILGPATEELTYRVGLFGLIKKKNKYLALICSAVIFALIHFNISATGDEMIIELLNLPSYLFAGFILGYSYSYNDSFVTSWTTHTINNLLSYISVLIN